MSTNELEKELVQAAKGLPRESLQEVIDFMLFLKFKKKARPRDSLTAQLRQLSQAETTHLEEEFMDYEKQYPRE